MKKQYEETNAMTMYEILIFYRKEIVQMKKAIKYLQIALGFIAVESMIGLIFITILLKMQVFVF